MPIGRVWIYHLRFVCNFVCVPLRISPPRIKLAASNFCTVVHRRPGQGISHFGELCSPQAQNWTNWPAGGPCIKLECVDRG